MIFLTFLGLVVLQPGHPRCTPHSVTQVHFPLLLQPRASQVVLVVKNLLANACRHERLELDPWIGKNPKGGVDNPLQYSCLENSMDTGAWWATVLGRKESDVTEAT